MSSKKPTVRSLLPFFLLSTPPARLKAAEEEAAAQGQRSASEIADLQEQVRAVWALLPVPCC